MCQCTDHLLRVAPLTDTEEITPTARPATWPPLGSTGSLFTDRAWIDLFADRIEGDHVWPLVEDGRYTYGLMGSIIGTELTSEAKSVRRLLSSPCRSLRTLGDKSEEVLSALASTAPAQEQWLPSLVYLFPGFECRVATDAGEPSGAVTDALVERAVAVADEVDAATVSFLFVPASEAALHSSLTRQGLRRFRAATESTLELPGTSFGDYEAWLNSSRRADLRKTYKDVDSWETSFARGSITDLTEELVDILVAERVKHGRRAARDEERMFLEGLCLLPSDKVHLTLARTAGKLSGFSVMLETEPGVRHLMSQGMTGGRAEYASLRLALNFYEPIRAAYASGVNRLSFGYGSEGQKKRRGCSVADLSGYVQARHPALRSYVDAVIGGVLGG